MTKDMNHPLIKASDAIENIGLCLSLDQHPDFGDGKLLGNPAKSAEMKGVFQEYAETLYWYEKYDGTELPDMTKVRTSLTLLKGMINSEHSKAKELLANIDSALETLTPNRGIRR